MTNKQTFWRTFVAVATMLLTMPATMWADSTFGGGSGTQSDPYKIYNASHFVQLSDEVNAGNTFEGVYFKLLNSVNFNMWGPIPPIGGQYYTEDGYTGNRRFCGYFLGNNCTLYNVTITDESAHCGIFGCLGYGGYVSDLRVDGNSTFTGIGYVGAIVGYAERNTHVSNCKVGKNVVVKVHPDAAGSAYSPIGFGGVVGTTSGYIWDCSSKATVTVSGINKTIELGGIAGSVGTTGRVEYCYFLGSVDGTNTVGDIAGANNGYINRCYYNTANRHGAVNGTDTDGAKWMGTVTMADGVSGSLPTPTYTDNNNYFAAGEYMLLTLDFTVPDGYYYNGVDKITYMANDVAIGETERAGKLYYEFTMPDEDVTISANVDLKRDISYTPWVQIDIPPITYIGEPLTPMVQVTDIKDGGSVVLTEGTHYTVTLPDEIIHVGEYTAVIEGIGDYACTANATFRVVPAGAVARVVTAPTAIEGLVYNGKPQVLITAGEAENGIMLYRLENEDYSTELPMATIYGTYVVYYKAHSDDDHLDSSEESLVAHIEKPEGSWAGEGTADAPYLITSVADMNLIAFKQEKMDYNGVYFSLENDIDYANSEQLVIGTMAKRFNGNFNGNGHKFTNMVINKPNDDRVAIFGVLGNNGVVTDLHLGQGCSITGAYYVGGFAGLSSGSIIGCTTAKDVAVEGGEEVGGIAGRCVGKIDRCVNQASIKANNIAGGICGSVYTGLSSAGVLSNNLNVGGVESSSNAGGIVGYVYNSTIANNYYAGDCTIGGLVGNDVEGQAQRGYVVSGDDEVAIELVENATVGVAFNEAVYAGNEQQIIVRLSVVEDEENNENPLLRDETLAFKVDKGTIVDNHDGTWTITMTDDDIVVSVQHHVSVEIVKDDNAANDNVWYTISGIRLTEKPTAAGIYIHNGKKVLVK